MYLPALSPRFSRWLLLMALVSGEHRLAAQTPIPDGSDRHPSDYRHPVLTWTQRDPIYLAPKKDRQESAADITGKLQRIIIPHVEFRATNLRDAIEFLRQESRRLDADPDPDNCGVNIFLKLPALLPPADASSAPTPGSGQPPSVADPKARVTLTLDRTPLLEALKYVASQAGMKIKVEPYAVSVVPLSESNEQFVTAEFPLLMSVLGLLADPDHSSSAMTWLHSKGVSFPPGTSATYLASSQKLVVRNTQENIDLIGQIISSASDTTTPKNP